MIRLCIYTLGVLQLIFTFGIAPANPLREYFPFYHWDLFTRTAPNGVIYRLKVHRGPEFSCWLEDCPALPPTLLNHRTFSWIQRAGRLGRSLPLLENALKNAFPPGFTYEIVKVSVDLKDYLSHAPRGEESSVFHSEAI